MRLILESLIVCGALLLTGCQALGPKPEITTSESEIKALKEVQIILVTPTLNTGSNDPEKDLNKTVPAGAFKRYGDNMLLTSGLSNTLTTLGFDKHLAELLSVNWQVAFYQWVKEQKGPKPAKAKMQLAIPPSGKKVAKSDKDLKKLSKALKKREKGLEGISKTVEGNLADPVVEAQAKAKKNLVVVENLFRYLIGRFDVSYVLVSFFDGSQAAFDKDAQITLHVALVNAASGKMRYYSQSTGKKSDLPTNLEGLLGMMVINLFDTVGEFDKIEY